MEEIEQEISVNGIEIIRGEFGNPRELFLPSPADPESLITIYKYLTARGGTGMAREESGLSELAPRLICTHPRTPPDNL